MTFIKTLRANLIEVLLVWFFKTDERYASFGVSEGLLEESLFWYGIGVILINSAKTSDYAEIICFFVDELSLIGKCKGKTCFECKRPLETGDKQGFSIFIEVATTILLDYKGEQKDYFNYHVPIDARIRECGHIFHKGCFDKNITKCAYCN